MIQTSEILETLRMINQEKLDVRTITMGISLFDCVCDDAKRLAGRVYDRITRQAERLVAVGEEIERDFGVRMTRAEERLRATLPDPEQARLLQVDAGTPLLQVERISLTYNDMPVEVRKALYRTDTHHYRNTLS